LEMESPQTGSLTYIKTFEDLRSLAESLQDTPYLSVDTESNSLFVYREQVCLVQITVGENDYLIDTLSVTDLSPLAPIFANPAQEKIFHAAEYDLICLKRDYGFEIANIFDTMISARILGELAFGLGSLLQSKLNITLDKKYQRANWGTRPLSQEMLEYARHDSHYLYALRTILRQELIERSLLDLALEDFRLGCEVNSHNSQPNPAVWWKVAGAAEISPAEAAILQALCDFREEMAARRNVPPFKIINNELLVYLTKEQPAQLEDLEKIHGFSPYMQKSLGNQILKVIESAKSAPPLLRPSRQRPDDRYLRRLDALKDWRKLKGKELKVESDVVLPREFLEIIAAENPASTHQLHSLMARIPWRYQHFGKEIFSVLRKQEVQ